jgi:3-phosphoshikimate 1-carboxyvinyltransferase
LSLKKTEKLQLSYSRKKVFIVGRDEMVEKIKNLHSLRGEMFLPGDKSISHRALMFTSMAKGNSEITGLSSSEDVQSTKQCLQQMGIKIKQDKNNTYVEGKGLHGFQEPGSVLDAGNSGTTIRLLSGILVGQKFSSAITGDSSLKSRPMKRIIEPLKKIGGNIEGEKNQYAPLNIKPGNLKGYNHKLNIASAQLKSCLLLAGLFANGTTTVTEPSNSRDHTERMLKYLDANLITEDRTVTINSFPELNPCSINVPGDISAAAFFIIAALLTSNSSILIKNVGMNPTRTGIIDVLKEMGAHFFIKNQTVKNNEETADILINSCGLQGVEIKGSIIPRVIDEIPVLAVAATQAKGQTIIKDARELRVKETDRIKAVVENLHRMGAQLTELENGMIIQGNQKLRGAEIDSYGDHRIAMAFTIAGLIAEGLTTIKNPDCVKISHPNFFQQLKELADD